MTHKLCLKKSETELTASVLKKDPKTHKRLKERFLIRRNRMKKRVTAGEVDTRGKELGKCTHQWLHVGKTARLGSPKSASPTSIRPKAATTPNPKTHFTRTLLSFPLSLSLPFYLSLRPSLFPYLPRSPLYLSFSLCVKIQSQWATEILTFFIHTTGGHGAQSERDFFLSQSQKVCCVFLARFYGFRS